MSTPEPRPTVRIITYNAKLAGVLRTVNVVTANASDKGAKVKEYLQATAAQITKDVHHMIPTFMAAGSTQKGLPTIYVSGYSGTS